MLEAVGHPVAVNPDATLDRHAHDHGWPIVHLRQRTKAVIRRTVAGAAHGAPSPAARFAAGTALRRRGAVTRFRTAGSAPDGPIGSAERSGVAGRGSVAFDAREPLLRHDADLLRERRSPTSATRTRRSSATRSPAGTACSATTSRSSPAPTSTASRSSRRPRPPASRRKEFADDDRARVRRRVEAARHHQRRLHPHHRAAPPRRASRSCCRRCYDAGDIELGTYSGLYCVRCEEYYTDDDLLARRPVPDPQDARSSTSRRRTTSSASRRFQDRLLDWYAAHPGAIVPEFRGNEALGLIRVGLRDFSISRTSLAVGHPAAVGPEPRHLRVVRRAHQLHDRRRLRHRRRALRASGGRSTTTSSARTSSASTACTGRRCCCRPASSRRRAGPSAAACSSAARR